MGKIARLGAVIFIFLSTQFLWGQFLWGQSAPDTPSGASVGFFDPSNKMLGLSEPLRIGVDGFAARIEAVRASGREPLGLVLSGGSARAYAHIGVLRVLESAGIVPDFIVANSMGAVIGLLYAAGLSPDSIATMMERLPPESMLDLVLPTKGGLLNADRLAAAVRFALGDLKIEDLPIPILVTMEDLESRRHVQIASGDFSRILTAAFALPGIFEPARIGGATLIDGGITNLIPASDAAEFSKSLIVSATLYDRDLSFSNPVTVINRAIDIGKTRTAMSELGKIRPAVIRNDVEKLSFMAFSDPKTIIALGEASARSALPEVLETIGPGAGAGVVSPETAAARVALGAELDRTLDDLERGVRTAVDPSLRWKFRLRLMDKYEGSIFGGDGGRYSGLGADFAAGKLRLGFSALAGLGMPAEKAWGTAATLSAGIVDALVLDGEARLFGGVPDSGFPLVPKSIEAAVALHWNSGGNLFAAKPRLSFRMAVPFSVADVSWFGLADVEIDAVGFGAFAGSLDMGGFVDSEGSAGPSWIAKLNAAFPGLGRVSARTAGRWDFTGSGTDPWSSDAFRGTTLEGKAAFRTVINVETAWYAKALGFDAAEAVIVKDIEMGPYLDLAWAGNAGTFGPGPDSGAAGVAISLTASFVGLAPFSVSSFAGFDFHGLPVLGIRAGRLFDF